jgi:RecB family exonuclease
MPRIVYTAIPATTPDYRQIEVITPHPAAARAIGAPHRSLQTAAENVVDAHGFKVAPPLIARRTLVRAVAQVTGADEADVDTSAALATRLLLPLQTVMRADIDPARLDEFGSERVKQLAAVVVTYRKLLRENALLDEAELLQFAAGLEQEQHCLYVHGFFRARPEEVAFINAAAAGGSVMVLPVHDHPMFRANAAALDRFAAHGWSAEAPVTVSGQLGARLAARFRGNAAAVMPGETTAIGYPDIDAEVRGALGQIKTLLAAGIPPAKIVLTARDVRLYSEAVAAVATEYGVPVHRNYRIGLAETNCGNWLKLLLDAARDELPFEPTLRLVAHPLGAGIEAGDWSQARAFHAHGIAEWSETAPALTALDWPKKATRSEWVARFTACLKTFRLRQFCVDQPRDLLALDQLMTALTDDFHATETLDRGRFADEVAGILSLLTVPVDPGTGGVDMHEPQTLSGAAYDHLFVLGAVDGILPGPVEDNPVVDFFARRQLAQNGVEFESAADIARWEELGFHFLLESGTGHVHFSFAQMLEGKPKEPSDYLERLQLAGENATADATMVFSFPEWRRQMLGAATGDDRVLTAARRARAIELRRETDTEYDEFDGVTGVQGSAANRMWSASQLLKLGQCPFRWFAEKVLRAQPVTEPDLGLAPDVLGRLYHKVLELVLADVPVGTDPREWARQKLDESFTAAETDAEVALPHLPAWPAQRMEHLDILRAAIKSEDFLGTGARVIDREVEFRAQWHGLRVMGYIDRVDQTPDGLVFIDYKTGGKPNGIKGRSGALEQDVQIPIYIEAAAPSLYPSRPVSSGYYYSIRKAKSVGEVGAAAIPELREFADLVRRRLTTGNFPVDPDAKQDACKYCDYESMCRKGHRLTRKTSR